MTDDKILLEQSWLAETDRSCSNNANEVDWHSTALSEDDIVV